MQLHALLPAPALTGGARRAQTTAYQALSGPGQLSKISTGVQFKISNPADNAVRAPAATHALRCCRAGATGLHVGGWAPMRPVGRL